MGKSRLNAIVETDFFLLLLLFRFIREATFVLVAYASEVNVV